MTTICKGKEQEIRYDEDGGAYVMHGKQKVPLSAFYRELARFVDWELKFWHAMDCTRDLVIHISRDGETCILGKVSG